MNQELQRIAIAEAYGWKHVEDCMGYPPDPNYDRTIFGNGMLHLPNYLFDLNAMHEAEKVLNFKLDCETHSLGRYHRWLGEICGREPEKSVWPTWHATAAQRAEAFLRTLNLWKD